MMDGCIIETKPSIVGFLYIIEQAKLPGYTRRLGYVECTKSFCLTEQLLKTAHGSICHKEIYLAYIRWHITMNYCDDDTETRMTIIL